MRLILLAVVLFPFAAHAQSDVVLFPTSGNWTVRAQTAPVMADHWDTASVELRRELDDTRVACQDAGPNQIVSITVTAALTDTPWRLRGFAWTQAACAGNVSDPSPNAAALDKSAPGVVVIVP